MAHPIHGRVALTSAPAFPEEARRDPAAVRRYRAALADPEREGFGATLATPVRVDLLGSAIRAAAGDAEVVTFAPEGRAAAVQLFRGPRAREVAGRWRGGRLSRAAYTQLTEGGPLPPSSSAPREGADGDVRWVEDLALGAAAAIATLDLEIGTAVAVGLASERELAAREALATAADAESLLRRELVREVPTAPVAAPGENAPYIERGIRYALDCAACDIGAGAVALLADHEILPLVWTRDAYYVARALLAVAPHDARVRAVVEGFIRWLFGRAEVVDGAWPRSSLASGQAKDPAFQLDQQLYPLLLLADHARLTGDAALRDRYGARAEAVLDALLARASPDGLVATAETPADDPLSQPYHFSSHVLLWRTCVALGRDRGGAVRSGVADRLRRAIREHFTSEGRFAYAVAGPRGAGARHYHDANDLPTVFAPGWGFCAADDPVWRATVDFAWSEANEGYVPGKYAGLGSLHTLHPWPLGDLQRVIVARSIGDAAVEGAAFARLAEVETWDGMLPEAYDEVDGSVASRHWFAWPVALRAMLLADPALVGP